MGASESSQEQPRAPEQAERARGPDGELEALRAEVEQLRDRNLRLIAEARNLQQRALRDKEEALRYAEADFARELLVVIDDLERTLASAGDDPNAAPAALVEGVRIVYDHFLKVLRSRGIEPIEAVGRPFDPHLHEALAQRPADPEAGTVVQEAARGYRMRERVLRPARVIVSSGPGSNPPA